MSGASGAPACRSSSRAGTRAATSSPARCRCSRSCSSARCWARSTASGPWANLAAGLGGLAILLSGFGLLNLLRGRRFFELPHRVGRLELGIFVVLPALLPLVFSGQVVSALVTAAANLALLALVYLVIGFGLVFILRWAARQLPQGLTTSLAALTRAIPLLLVFSLVLFINTEMWQVFSLMPQAYVLAVAGLLALVAAAFLVGRLPREVVRLQGDGPELNPRQRVNVGLVMFVSQALQVLVVSLALAGFFVVFGALTIGPEVRESWIGSRRHADRALARAPRRPAHDHRGAAARVGRDRRVRRRLLRDRGAHRLDLPRGVPRRHRRRAARDVRPARRVPRAQRFIATYLISRYSWMPSAPPSRPKPDCLTPPNGAAGFETRPWLRPTMPVSSASQTRNARLMSLV